MTTAIIIIRFTRVFGSRAIFAEGPAAEKRETTTAARRYTLFKYNNVLYIICMGYYTTVNIPPMGGNFTFLPDVYDCNAIRFGDARGFE